MSSLFENISPLLQNMSGTIAEQEQLFCIYLYEID